MNEDLFTTTTEVMESTEDIPSSDQFTVGADTPFVGAIVAGIIGGVIGAAVAEAF